MTQVVILILTAFLSLFVGWFLASLAWASARADLEAEIMELRQRVWNLTRDERAA